MASEHPYNPFQIDQESAAEVLGTRKIQEIAKVCNVDPRDHLHVVRAGSKGSGLKGRGALLTHEGESTTRIFLAAPELREVAAALLNVADDLDGITRLNFVPPAMPEADEHEHDDDEENDE